MLVNPNNFSAKHVNLQLVQTPEFDQQDFVNSAFASLSQSVELVTVLPCTMLLAACHPTRYVFFQYSNFFIHFFYIFAFFVVFSLKIKSNAWLCTRKPYFLFGKRLVRPLLKIFLITKFLKFRNEILGRLGINFMEILVKIFKKFQVCFRKKKKEKFWQKCCTVMNQ